MYAFHDIFNMVWDEKFWDEKFRVEFFFLVFVCVSFDSKCDSDEGVYVPTIIMDYGK